MAEHSRYNVGKYYDHAVLPNKLGITDLKTLEDIETLLFSDTYNHMLEQLWDAKAKKLASLFDVKLIFEIHKYFLGTLYVWAGEPRTVEISKGRTFFCASSQIPKELKIFDELLKKNLPLPQDKKEIVSKKFAVIHCEFNAIHPFREGNGRTIRLFLDLLALNAGFTMIDYSKSSQNVYIKACIAGMQKDYSKMRKVIFRGLKKLEF